jgi:thiamine biosynthesis lipoprotein
LLFLVISVPIDGAESSKTPPLERLEFAEIHMGTEFRVVLYSGQHEAATTAAKQALARIGELDQTLSDYRDDSELTLLSKRSGSPPVRVGDDLWRVLERAQEVSRQSEGAFDVSVGPAVRLWRRARRTRVIPTRERVSQVLPRIGFEKIVLIPETKEIELRSKEMILDLGGIAKGFAVDEAMKVLKKGGFSRSMVVGGGEIAVGEPPPDAKGWRIALNQPGETSRLREEYLVLSNANVSTSGDASQFVEVDGVRYSHVIDPRTGQALTTRRQVTVVAAEGMTADACASALGVLGRGPVADRMVAWGKLAVRCDEATKTGWETWTTPSWHSIPKESVRPAEK